MRDTDTKTETIARADDQRAQRQISIDTALARAEMMLTSPACVGLVRLSWRLSVALDEDFIAEWHHLCALIGDDLTRDRIENEELKLAQHLRDLDA